MTPQLTATAGVLRLAAEVRSLLESLPDLCVRGFLADWPQIIAPTRTIAARELPVLRWSSHLLAERSGIKSNLVAYFLQTQDQLAWSQTYSIEDFGTTFLDRYGWTELIGARGPIASETLACGFLLLGPDVEYPLHHHTAEEIYVVLSGTASWRRSDEPWTERLPSAVVHHTSNMAHAMRTDREPLLALYLWRAGDLMQKSIIDQTPGALSINLR
jgi:mannose-6-phosphate isomerase-like protein (cupin superfamily)